MLSTRDFTEDETIKFGTFGRIHDESNFPIRERVGIILIHGRAGNEKLMWVFSRVIEGLDPIVIAPRALVKDDIGGYSWWNVNQPPQISNSISPKETKLLQIEPACNVITNIAKLLPEMYGVNSNKIFAIGFSQGGAVAISVALRESNLFRGVGMLASFIPSVVQSEYAASDFYDLDVFMSHGTLDEIIPFSRAEESVEFIEHVGGKVYFNKDEVGHKISSSGLKSFKEWITARV